MNLDRTGHVHRPGLAGESAAFDKAAAQAPAMWLHIMAEFELGGDAGMTPDEYAERFGKLINTVRRRFTDLWKQGRIRHHPEGLHRPNSAGNPCVVWVIGADPEVAALRDHRPRGRPPLSERRILELAPSTLLPLEAVGFARAIEAEVA